MIVAAVFTCGRREYLEETLASFRANVAGPVTRIVAFDDSGDFRFTAWLETLGISVASWGENVGYGESMRRAWLWLDGHAVEPYVFHLEEDFVFDRPVDLCDLVTVLDGDPDLDQVALLRGPWFPSELRAGGIVERNVAAYEPRQVAGLDYLAHGEIFTMNPSIYRRSLCAEGWPAEPRSERLFTRTRRGQGRRFAYLGDGAPWISHIGRVRTGHGY